MDTKPAHYAALDGLRAIACLLVLRIHLSGPCAFPAIDSVWGCRGVYLFFILSGFLITRILLRERQRGSANLLRFYVHRAGRIFPLYFAVVGALLLVYGWRWETVGCLTYTYNFAAMKHPQELFPASPFWSLAVEEHFYLVWPLLVALLPLAWSRRAALAAAVGAMGLAAVLCWQFGATDAVRSIVYGNSAVQAAPLAVGCLLAYAEPQLREKPRRLLCLAGGALLAFYAIAPAIEWRMGANAGYYHEFSEHASNTALALAGFALTLWCAFGAGWSPLTGLLTDARMQYVGRISYGLYILHLPIYWLAGCAEAPGAPGGLLRSTLAIAAVFALAAASHRWFETPVRNWAKGLVSADRRESVAALPGADLLPR